MALLDDLLELERAGWDALTTSAGGAFYADAMTEDGIMVLVNGAAIGRDDVVRTLDASEPWARYDVTDAAAVPLTDDVAVLYYRVTALRDPEDPAFAGLLASTYVRRDGAWKLAFHQQTAVPAVEA
jgi:hypothetical protein